MPYLLNIVYLLLLAGASPWLLYAALRHGKYRDGLAAKLLGRTPVRGGSRRCIWLHAVSVGEVNLLKPLLMRLEQQHPDHDCVISTTTRTGFELARQKYSPRPVFYCPLDFSWAVNAALRRIRPDLLVLAELELWPNLISAARRRGVKVAVVNGRLSEKSFRGYRRIRWLMRRWLPRLDLVASQTEEYSRRFLELGADPRTVVTTGSVKFDGASSDRANPATRRLERLAGFRPDDVVFLAGSTQAPEETMAIAAFRELADAFPRLRLVIVPRHPERFDEVARLLDASGLPWRRRSLLNGESSAEVGRILLVDTVGELGAWWGAARIAFVGGSFGSRGGQNMIEPAAYGAAVSFGPQTKNFRDVVESLLTRDAATTLHDGSEMTAWVRRCLSDPEFRDGLGTRAQQMVREQQGATERTVRLLSPLLDGGRPVPEARQFAA